MEEVELRKEDDGQGENTSPYHEHHRVEHGCFVSVLEPSNHRAILILELLLSNILVILSEVDG